MDRGEVEKYLHIATISRVRKWPEKITIRIWIFKHKLPFDFISQKFIQTRRTVDKSGLRRPMSSGSFVRNCYDHTKARESMQYFAFFIPDVKIMTIINFYISLYFFLLRHVF